MTSSLHRNARIVRRLAWYALAITLVVMALLAGIASQLLPLAERHPEAVAAWISARAGRTVAFDSLATQWTRRGPLLQVQGLRVGDGTAAVPIGEAEILIAQYSGLWPGRSLTELRLRNLSLTVQRAGDGTWRVLGLPGQRDSGGDPFAALEGLGELQVIGARLRIDAPGLQLQATVPRIDARVQVDGDRIRAGVQARMASDGPPLTAVLALSRRSGDGEVYAGFKAADIASWASLLHAAGIAITSGNGRAEAWGVLHARRIAQVTVRAALRDVALRGAPIAAAGAAAASAGAAGMPTARFAQLDTLARWQASPTGWRVDAPRLRIGTQARPQVLDGLLVFGGAHFGMLADRVDAGPLFALAALSDAVSPGLRGWLSQAAPQAVLHDVSVAGVRDGALRIDARVDGLGFAAVGRRPGLAGLSTSVQADRSGFTLAFDPKAQVTLQWAQALSGPLRTQLHGAVSGWRAGAGWQIASPALRLDGDGFGADLRGGIELAGDGTRPQLDAAVHVDPIALVRARSFWRHDDAAPKALGWLDRALLGGGLRDGRALISGDLDDWPFRNGKGVFSAAGHIHDTVLRFHPDWPATDRLDGDLSFSGTGFAVVGNAVVAGVKVPTLDGGIADFSHSLLTVRAGIDSEMGTMLAMLRRSPLQAMRNEAVQKVSARGPATGTFALDLGLYPGAPRPVVDGVVQMQGVQLAQAQWDLAFGNVRGALHYDQLGFDADKLAAQHDGRPAALSLRAGDGHVRDAAQAFEAELAAPMSAQELLDRAPQLAWLKPSIEGVSSWRIDVTVAAGNGKADPPSRLQLHSSLVGTTLRLPAPMDKAAGVALATSVDTLLPLGSSDIQVAFGDVLALRARTRGDQTGVRVVLGSSSVGDAPPPSGLVATGRSATLDAIEWAALSRGNGTAPDGAPGAGNALPLRSIDVVVDDLQLIGSGFANTRIRATPTATGTAVQFDGPALAGGLVLPSAASATISGRLQRLYWRNPGPVAAALAAAVPAAAAPGIAAATSDAVAAGTPPAVDDTDPAAIPPLNLVVDALHMGAADIGATTLRTSQLGNGMRIDQLQARSARQRIDMTGQWTGRGATARTALDARLSSDDFGALLAGVGLGARVSGGKGDAHLQVEWPGGPAQFAVASLQGSLQVAMKDGQLVQVAPGAGRVLGLLSIAEIPRRLTLDFGDFFDKGFAFNRIAGTLQFAAGSARSDGLVIEGPAADIHISGTADLRAQQFDQTIDVFPKTGNLLTAVGAIAGGPVGAAVGAVATAVLSKPLSQMSARTYRVTGPFKDPKVTVVGREARNGKPRAAPPG